MPASATHRFSNGLRRREGTHEAQRQLTPPYVLEPVREALGGIIQLDPCTEPDNPTQAESYYTPADDGLSQSWAGADTIFLNPPYGEARVAWVNRAITEAKRGARVIALIPSHTDTRIFQRALHSATEIVFIKGRVKFGVVRKNGRQEAASHPSALIGWNVSLVPCAVLGKRLRLES